MAGWETVGRTEGDWEPVLQGPVGEGYPFTNAVEEEATFQAKEAQTAEAKKLQLQDWRLGNIRRQFGPASAAAIGAGNEIMQPFLGAAELMGSESAGEIANDFQFKTDMINEANPGFATAGSVLPYLGTGPAATAAYMKGVAKLAPGVLKGGLTRPIMSSTIPGAIEGGVIGALSPQQTALSGAAFGAGGSYAGQKLLAPLSASPTNLSQYDESMLNIAKDWKLEGNPNSSIYDYMLAGAKTGNLAAKELDDALAANSTSRLPIAHRFDVPQEELTRRVLKDAGLDAGHIEESALWKHRRALGKQYDDLERNSTPVYSPKTEDDLLNSRAAYEDLSPSDNTKWIDAQEERFTRVNRGGNVTLNAYRGLKNELSEAIKRFEGKPLGEESAARKSVYMDQLAILRDMMKQGSNDPTTLKQWDILDRQFAKTRFLEDNKIVKDGTIDFNRLYTVLGTKRPKDLANLSDDTAKAASLGRYIDKSRVSTLGERSKVNSELGARQSSKGFLGHLANINRRIGLDASVPLQYYQWANPRKGLMRLPQTAPLMMGGPAGSAVSRGALMDKK